jgi:hypothetical protein
MVVDFAGEIRVILFGGLEHNLQRIPSLEYALSTCRIARTYLRAIEKFVRSKVYLPERALANQPP